jgi:iron complex transport system ATP-binding protein
MLKDGSLVAVGIPEIVITPEIVAQVFGVQVAIIDTPVGLQLCPLASIE